MSGHKLQSSGVRFEQGLAGRETRLVMPARRPVFLMPVVLFLLLGLLVMVFWRIEVQYERRSIESKLMVSASQLARRVQQAVDDRVQPLRRLAQQRLNGELHNPEEFASAAKLVLADLQPYRAIWLVSDLKDQPPEVAEVYRLAIEQKEEDDRGVMVELPRTQELLIGIPVVDEEPKKGVLGVVVGRLQLEPLLRQVVDEAQRERYEIMLMGSDDRILYHQGAAVPGWEGGHETLEVLGVRWGLRIMPTAAYVAANAGRSPWMVLWGGLGSSLLITLGVGQWGVLRRRRERETRSHLEALERLNELSATISAKLGSGPQVMEQLAQLACDLMGMDSAIVGIADSTYQRVNVVATVGVHSLGRGDYQLDAAPGVRHSLSTGQIIIVEDSEKIKVLVNGNEMRRIGVRSMMQLPLRIESRVIGILIVGDRAPHVIDQMKVHVARLLANQAAVILANHRLYEQMDEAITVQRREAETRSVLLHELNHRVKNSLAGIVALLSVGEPEMPAEARQWLGRVIDRINNMARTHELLSGGMQTVGLNDLVERMLPSLAVVKPAGVRIVTDVGGVDVVLGTERAVGLAMVLHELCYNAIVHGTGEDGCVTIRAGAAEGQRVMVEVMDDGRRGRRMKVDGEPMRQGGMGLTLVRGLVSRELGGEFSLSERESGGTVARVIFPLRGDETNIVSI